MNRMRLRERAKEWLASRRSTAWLVLLGVALTAPSLRTGLASDDYLQAVALRGLPIPVPQRGAWDLFRFANGDEHLARVLMDRGEFAWTADPTLRFGFFRPLAAATHIFDYATWPNVPALMHAQNLAWYAAAILGAAVLFRRLLGATWVAGFAVLLFAIDHTHAVAVTWIAGRNGVICLALGLQVLVLHDRWRREGWRPGAWLAPLLFGAALFSGESALATGAFLLAYAVHIDPGGWRARLLSLAPFLPVLVGWRTAYGLLGYGVAGSGMYIDPVRRPLAFAGALAHRLPHLLVGELAFPPSDLSTFYEYLAPSAPAWGLFYALVVLALFGAAMVPLLRRDPVARFFASGMVLAAIPLCGAFAMDRLLIFVSVGCAGLVAQFIASAASSGARIAALFLILFHLVLAPPELALGSVEPPYQRPVDLTEATVPRTKEIESKTVVLVNPPNDACGIYLSSVRAVRSEPEPTYLYELAAGTAAVEVTREDSTSLRVRPAHGFLEHEADRLFRALDPPLGTGTVVRLSRMTATVTAETPDRRPAEVLFRFDAPLEDASFVWMRWAHDGFAPWVPPAIGETIFLPAFDARRIALDLGG